MCSETSVSTTALSRSSVSCDCSLALHPHSEIWMPSITTFGSNSKECSAVSVVKALSSLVVKKICKRWLPWEEACGTILQNCSSTQHQHISFSEALNGSESYSNVIFNTICGTKKRVPSSCFCRFPSVAGNDGRAAHRPLWMAAITVPWPFRSHTNKEIYDLVQCAIKVHVVIPSTFTARSGYAALLLQVYSLLVEKQLHVFLGGKREKAEVVRVDERSRLAKREQVPKHLVIKCKNTRLLHGVGDF